MSKMCYKLSYIKVHIRVGDNMFYRLRETFARFMYGRYGMDSLNKFLAIFYIALAFINMFVLRINGRGVAYFIFYVLETAAFLAFLLRMLSRNIYKRQQENIKYLNVSSSVKGYINKKKMQWQCRKTHVFRVCPNCKATVKLPKKKGKHTCTCPKCRVDFKVTI